MPTRRILILTASIGSGHIKAAEAVEEELRRLLPEAELTTVDFMARKTSFLHFLMKKLYLVMLSLVPNLYDIFYKVAGVSSSGSLVQSAFSHLMQPVLSRILQKHRPDYVICTHPFPEGAAVLWKKRTKRHLPLAVVMTDYSLHQIWLYPMVEQYFMATDAMKKQMEERGFSSSKLFATGIPVRQTESSETKREARRALNLPEQQAVVLMMGGGLGLGGMQETLRDLESINAVLTVLIVTGKNETLYLSMNESAKKSRHFVKVWQYTNQVHQLMQSADLLITKPGALTISEAFVMGLPMLLHDPIPGPETENAVYATRNGAAVWLHPGEKLAPAVWELLSGDCLFEMSKQAKRCGRPGAAREIAQHIVKRMGEEDGRISTGNG